MKLFPLQNQNQVGTALQVFYNLNELSNIVSKVVRDSRDSVKQAVSDTFDQRALAGTADSDRTAGESLSLTIAVLVIK